MKKDNYLLHLVLFLISVLTTTLAGAELITGKALIGFEGIPENYLLSLSDYPKGLIYSLCFLSFLTVHEFGHYFTALYHNVSSSLPYYIPIFIPLAGAINIGSFGAIIKIKEPPSTTRKYFDIGIAGPLAGFVVSLTLLTIGFLTLPEPLDYIGKIHPDYLSVFGKVPTIPEIFEKYPHSSEVYIVGSNFLMEFFKTIFSSKMHLFPPPHELIHYPFLFVGYLTLFFTALNLLPIGQLDGGHVMYGLFGPQKAGIISRITVLILLFFGGSGLMKINDLSELPYLIPYGFFITFCFGKLLKNKGLLVLLSLTVLTLLLQAILVYVFPSLKPNLIWLIYAFMAVKFIGLDHPRALYEHRLSTGRKVLGWIAIVIFILSFSISPLDIVSSVPL